MKKGIVAVSVLVAVGAAGVTRPAAAATADEPITAAWAAYVEAEYGEAHYPACSDWGQDLVWCFAITNLNTLDMVAGFGGRQDADSEWTFTPSPYAQIEGPDDTLMSDNEDFRAADPELLGRAMIWLHANLPDAADPAGLAFLTATMCDPISTTNDEFFLFQTLGETFDGARDLYRAVCPDRMRDAGF